MPSSCFLIFISIGEAYGDFDGWMTLADNYPLIISAKISRDLGVIGLTCCAIGFAPPTSKSQTEPCAAGSNAFPLPINKR